MSLSEPSAPASGRRSTVALPRGTGKTVFTQGPCPGGFERVHRKVELLHAPADEVDQRPAERPEQRRPLRPHVEVVATGVLVEVAHGRVEAARVEAVAIEKG